jgi:biotin synthesis protein BioG
MRNKVVVFALGWGCDQRMAENQMSALSGADILWLYDWRQQLTGAQARATRDRVAAYKERYLVAWSFGVWAAERLFAGMEFTRTAALNGTPLPGHDKLGIGSKRLRVTLRGLQGRGMEEFSRRAYGECYPRMLPALDPRGVGANVQELRTLIEESEKPFTPSLRWDVAVVGSGDEIFPPQNMAAYWGGRAKTLPLPHFPFEDPGLSASLLGFDD